MLRRSAMEKKKKNRKKTRKIARVATMYLFWSLKLKRGNRELKSSTWNVVAAAAEGGVRGFLSFCWMRLWRSSSSSEDESICVGLMATAETESGIELVTQWWQ